MRSPIDFFFDFASPYAYFIAPRLSALAISHGRDLKWRPVLLWTVLQTMGLPAPMASTAKRDYLLHDMARSARFFGLDYRWPTHVPTSTHLFARALYWVTNDRPALAEPLAMAMFKGLFIRDVNPRDPAVVAEIGAGFGIDRDETLAAIEEPRWKTALKEAGEGAVAAGMCGSPFVVIDGEKFFGADRLPQIERWLEQGGF
ncbi:MAG: 2-hydroxychromene-2-carboxylate isomerase [Alphaproteobacteria bacterium]|nr:2-hydroxychromene-2-carboxylate isomerase [Alphaproteobacteria bacterium]